MSRKRRTTPRFFERPDCPIFTRCFSPDGCLIAAGGGPQGNCELTVWETVSGNLQFALTERVGSFDHITFSPAGTIIAAGGLTKASVTTRVAEDPSTAASLAQAATEYVEAVCFSPDGQLLGIAGANKMARLVDVTTGRVVQTLIGHEGTVYDLCFSSDGKFVITGDLYGKIRVWDCSTGALERVIDAHGDIIPELAISRTGRLLASCSRGEARIGEAALWDVGTWTLRARIPANRRIVDHVAISPCGHLLATAGEDNNIMLYSTNTSRLVTTLKGHLHFVSSIQFSPDGSLLAAADDRVVIWDLRELGVRDAEE